jgi:hypothetical protein
MEDRASKIPKKIDSKKEKVGSKREKSREEAGCKSSFGLAKLSGQAE